MSQIRFRHRGSLGRFIRDRRGATAIEFAIVVGPFIFLVGGIIEFGFMLFTEYTLQNAVQDAARQIQVGKVRSASSNLLPVTQPAAFKTLICDRAPNLKDCTNKIGVYVQNATNFASLASNVPSAIMISPGVFDTFNTGVGRQPVAVIAVYDWTFTFPFMRMFNNTDQGTRRLQGIAVFQNEAFSDT